MPIDRHWVDGALAGRLASGCSNYSVTQLLSAFIAISAAPFVL